MTDAPTPFRVGYVAKMFPRISETFVLNEILELERQGVEVTIFSAKKPDEGRFHPQLARLRARVHYLDGLEGKGWTTWAARNWSHVSPDAASIWQLMESALSEGRSKDIEQIWMAAQMAMVAREEGIQALHAHFATLPATLAHLCHRIAGIPFSFTAHAKDIFVYSPEETNLLQLVEDAHFVITVTHFNRRYLQTLLPEPLHAKIRVLHNGIDLDRFEYVQPRQREDAHILAVGRLVAKKGFDELLRALAKLRDRGTDFRCTLAGGGPMEQELLALRDELGLQGHLTSTGAVDSDVVRSLMREATVFALPCKVADDQNMDALPTVLLESLACGLPSVSTNLSGIPEIIESPREGLLVECADIEALADSIESLLLSSSLREQIAEAGRAKAERAFDIRRNVATLHGYFRGQDPAMPRQVDTRGHYLYLCTDRGIRLGGNKGASVHVREFVAAMAEQGFDATLALRGYASSSSPSRAERSLLLPKIDLAASPSPAEAEADEYAANDRFVEYLDVEGVSERCEFIYERYSLFGTTGLELARRWRLPFFVEVNAPLIHEARAHRNLQLEPLAREVAARVFAGADHVFAVSDEVRLHVLELAPDARVSVLANGVDPRRFAVEAPARSDGEDLRIGFVGRVRPWHGVDQLLLAAAEAQRTGVDLRVSIVGECRELRSELESLAREHSILDRVDFVGAVDPDEIPGILAGFDVVAAPYPANENFYFSPLKVYEYMAAGRAILASSIGQIEEVLEHGRTAWLVQPGDVPALASGIRTLAADRALRQRLGDGAREEAADKHSWARRLEILHSRIAESSAPRRLVAT